MKFVSQTTPAVRTFQDLILALQQYWAEQGCVVLQPYDMEVGAGTFHTATFLRAIGPETWNAAYVQPSRRPADGRYGELLKLPQPRRGMPGAELEAYMYMKGNDVFKVAVTRLSEIVTETLAAANIDPSELDWLVPHQANFRIINATAKKLGMGLDKVILTLDRHGNTSAASVPIAFDEGVRDGRIKPGQLVLLEAFGGGFAWGSALVRL